MGVWLALAMGLWGGILSAHSELPVGCSISVSALSRFSVTEKQMREALFFDASGKMLTGTLFQQGTSYFLQFEWDEPIRICKGSPCLLEEGVEWQNGRIIFHFIK